MFSVISTITLGHFPFLNPPQISQIWITYLPQVHITHPNSVIK